MEIYQYMYMGKWVNDKTSKYMGKWVNDKTSRYILRYMGKWVNRVNE